MTVETPLAGHPESKTVVIDAFPSAPLKYAHGYAIIAVDVIRATTTAITAVALGRRCFMAPTVDDACVIAQDLENPLLAGEIGGNMPVGFEMNNSPAEIAERTDIHRPMVLVSSSGTLLAHNASLSGHGYLACLRNIDPTAIYLSARYRRIAIVGAGSRAEFREEDQACCARIASALVSLGYSPENEETSGIIDQWAKEAPEAWLKSNSVRFLRSSGQERDLEFTRAHYNDLSIAYRVRGDGEVLALDGIPEPFGEGKEGSGMPVGNGAGEDE